MIYIRDDDVLVHSSGNKHPFQAFSKIHRWLINEVPEHFLHIPTIVVKDIQAYPECVEYVREETKEGRMRPELHGLEHIDYNALNYGEVLEHLEQSIEWMKEELICIPTRWYTPWGANSDMLRAAAQQFNLQLVDTSNTIEPAKFLGYLRKLGRADYQNDFEIFIHWWERGLRVRRIVSVYKYATVAEAIKHDEPEIWK